VVENCIATQLLSYCLVKISLYEELKKEVKGNVVYKNTLAKPTEYKPHELNQIFLKGIHKHSYCLLSIVGKTLNEQTCYVCQSSYMLLEQISLYMSQIGTSQI